MQEETAPNVNNVSGLLKAFVIFAGVALLIGAILLAIMIMMRTASDRTPNQVTAPAGPVDLALPAGVRIAQVVADGKRLVLLGEDRDGLQYIAVVDADTGVQKTLIRLMPE